MTGYRRGDIILVPFPFSDQSTVKKRPAVIISSDVYNEFSADCVIMAVTSQTDKISDIGECVLSNWNEAGLLKPSCYKGGHINYRKNFNNQKNRQTFFWRF